MHSEESSSEFKYRISRGKKWSDNETQVLIKHLKENCSSLRGRGHHKAAIFERIARQLSARGIKRSGKEVNNKYKSLRAKYREACSSQGKHKGESSFKWFEQLDTLLNSATDIVQVRSTLPDSTDDTTRTSISADNHGSNQNELHDTTSRVEKNNTESKFPIFNLNDCRIGAPQSDVELITISDDTHDIIISEKNKSTLEKTPANQVTELHSQDDKSHQLGVLMNEIMQQSQASMTIQTRLCDSFANFTQLLGNLESALSAVPVLMTQLIQQSQQQLPYQRQAQPSSMVLMPPSSQQIVQSPYQQEFCSPFMLR